MRWGFDAASTASRSAWTTSHNTWRFGLDRVLPGVVMSDDAQAWLGTRAAARRRRQQRDRPGRPASPSSSTGWSPLTDRLTGRDHGRQLDRLLCVDGVDLARRGRARRPGRSARCSASSPGSRSRRRPRAAARCDCPTSARCCGTTSPGDPRAPTSAPARSPSARWCRCARSRTGSCAWSASTTACSRASGIVDGDDVLARRRSPASATSAPRTASSSSTRSAPRPRRSSSPTPAPTSTPARTGHPPSRSASCSTPSTGPREAPVRDAIVVRHPLQPYDVRNVEPGRLGVPTPFSFDPRMLAAARGRDRAPPGPARRSSPRRSPRRSAGAGPTTTSRSPTWSTFFQDPVKGFFRALDLTLPWDVDAVTDAMPVEIDQLETWGVGDRMLEDMLARHPPGQGARDRVAARRAAARPARLAQGHRGPRDRDEPRRRRAHPPPGRARRRTTSTSTLRGGRRLTGTVDARLRRPAGRRGLLQARRQAPARVVGATARPGRRAPRPQLDRPDDRPGAARQPGRPAPARPGRRGAARPARATWSRLYDRGPPRAAARCRSRPSFAWASAHARTGQDPEAEAVKKWKSSRYPGEDADAAHVRVWGEHADLDVLTDLPALRRAALVPPPRQRAGADVSDPNSCASPSTSSASCPRPDHDRARGQRRHRQDLRARRTGHPLRRRGQGAARRHAARSPSAGRRARSCASGSATSSSGGRGARRPGAVPTTPCSRTCRRARPRSCAERRRGLQDALAGFDARDHRDHPPVLPARPALARRRRRHRRRRDPRREPRRAGRRDRRRPLPPALRRR